MWNMQKIAKAFLKMNAINLMTAPGLQFVNDAAYD